MSKLPVTCPTWETDTFSPGLRLVTSIPLSAPSLSFFFYPSCSPVRLPLKPELYHSSATLLYFCWSLSLSLSLNLPHCFLSFFLSFFLPKPLNMCILKLFTLSSFYFLSRSLTLTKSLLRLSFSLRFIRTLEYLVSGLRRCSQLQSEWRGERGGTRIYFLSDFFLRHFTIKPYGLSCVCTNTHIYKCTSDSSCIS